MPRFLSRGISEGFSEGSDCTNSRQAQEWVTTIPLCPVKSCSVFIVINIFTNQNIQNQPKLSCENNCSSTNLNLLPYLWLGHSASSRSFKIGFLLTSEISGGIFSETTLNKFTEIIVKLWMDFLKESTKLLLQCYQQYYQQPQIYIRDRELNFPMTSIGTNQRRKIFPQTIHDL